MRIEFCPLASGSSGNATYIAVGETKILVDAGLSGIQIEKNLQQVDKSASDLSAIFLTHGHTDHIAGAGVLSRRYKIPIFATPGTWEIIEEKNTIGKIASNHKRYIHPSQGEMYGEIEIEAFSISHDCYEPVGFTFSSENIKTAVATDMGIVTKEVYEQLEDASVILLESNHDIDMLANGPYPYFLKQRVGGNKGHLSNEISGKLVSKLLEKNYLQTIYLGHLSEDNNTPVCAYETVSRYVGNRGLELYVAKRYQSSQLTVLEYTDNEIIPRKSLPGSLPPREDKKRNSFSLGGGGVREISLFSGE